MRHPLAWFSALLSILAFAGTATAQDMPNQCGCAYLKATSTNQGRVCRVQEVYKADCQLRWGPASGSQVTQATPFMSNPADLAASVAGFKGNISSPRPFQSTLESPDAWKKAIDIAHKYADLGGNPSPADELSAFLGREKLMADFRLDAALAAIILIDNELQLAKVARSQRQGLIGFLAASLNENTLGAFQAGRAPVLLKLSIPLIIDDKQLDRTIEVFVGRGCVAEQVAELGLAFMVKTNWSIGEMRRCER